MMATDANSASWTYKTSYEKLKKGVGGLLESIDDNLECHGIGKYSERYKAVDKAMLMCDLKSLIGTTSVDSEAWGDAMTYERSVILALQDTERRAVSLDSFLFRA
jgi:hypothetical protein